MKKIFKIVFASFFGLALIGCGNQGAAQDDGNSNSAGQKVDVNDQLIETNRKIIYSVTYSFNGKDFTETKDSIKAKTLELGGYIQSYTDNDYNSSYVYRIPTESLFTFTDYVDSFGGVSNKTLSTEDVTSNYNYISAQIETLEASIASYRKLLEDEELDMYNIMNIQDKINALQIELTTIYNNQASYDSKLNYSTVSINYYVEKAVVKKSFFGEYFEYVGDFFIGLGKFILYSLPIMIVLGGGFSAIFFPIYAKNKKRSKQENK